MRDWNLFVLAKFNCHLMCTGGNVAGPWAGITVLIVDPPRGITLLIN
jgi:hypothetical protein